MRGSPASAWLATRQDTIVQVLLVGLDGVLQVWFGTSMSTYIVCVGVSLRVGVTYLSEVAMRQVALSSLFGTVVDLDCIRDFNLLHCQYGAPIRYSGK
jgi:hypothetical protein